MTALRASSDDWEPGDPLFLRAAYRDGLYGFRDDASSETCGCADAARWPVTYDHRALSPDGDELGDFIAAWHRSRRESA